MFLSHPGVQHFQSPREFCLQETFPKPCPTQENNPLQQFYQNSFLRSKAFCPRQPLQNAQVKQLPWVLTALSSCGLRFVEKKSETRRSLGRAWGKALEIGNCWGQQKCGKHRILGQSVVTCRCCSFSPFIRKMMKHVRNMFQLGSSTTCQRMLPGCCNKSPGWKRHLAAIWLRAATKLNGGSKQQKSPHQQGIQQGIHKYHNETSGQKKL